MSSPPENDRPRQPRRTKRSQPSDGQESAPRSPAPGGWLILFILLAIVIVYLSFRSVGQGTEVDYSFFWQQLEEGNIEKVEFHGQKLVGEWKDPPKNPDGEEKLEKEFHTVLPPVEDRQVLEKLLAKNKVVKAEDTSTGLGTQMLLWLIGPVLILLFFWWMLRRSSDPMGSGMMGSFIRSQAKRFQPTAQRTTFDDVAAMEQAKSELQEVVEFLKNPAKFQRLGAQIPKGVLLMGPPGTGKTLLARAVAGEAEVPFYSINGSEFIQMFVGVGASRVRDLFRTAKDHAPCIIFIDEIDAVGRVRGAGVGGGHDEREQTLNQILSEMDGFEANESVIVIAATNRPDVLDPALLRPGRFDRHVTIDRPTREGRLGILKVHSRKVPLADDVDLKDVAGTTIGFSGAQLRNLVNEAALHASRTSQNVVTREDFEAAYDRVLMGPRREEILTEHEREMTAYHEAGHALIGWLLPEADPVHKVTIIPRGRTLGVTQFLPDDERFSVGEKRLRAQLMMMLGGRAAEKLVFDEYSAGAENDLKQATTLARRMVSSWGMSEIVGPVAFSQVEENPFLGREIHEQRHFSDETARIIDQEVQRFLMDASNQATEILEEHREKLDAVVEALMERESLGKEELIELIGERPVSAV